MDRFTDVVLKYKRYWDRVPWHVSACRSERQRYNCVIRWWLIFTVCLCLLTRSLQPAVVSTVFLGLLIWWYYHQKQEDLDHDEEDHPHHRSRGSAAPAQVVPDEVRQEQQEQQEQQQWETMLPPPPPPPMQPLSAEAAAAGFVDRSQFVGAPAAGGDPLSSGQWVSAQPQTVSGPLDPSQLPPCPVPFVPDVNAAPNMLVSCAQTRFAHAVQRPPQRDEQAIRLWQRQMDAAVRPAEDPDVGPGGPSREAFARALRMQPNHKYNSIFRRAQEPLQLAEDAVFKVPYVASRAVNPVRADITAKTVPQWPVFHGGHPLDAVQ